MCIFHLTLSLLQYNFVFHQTTKGIHYHHQGALCVWGFKSLPSLTSQQHSTQLTTTSFLIHLLPLPSMASHPWFSSYLSQYFTVSFATYILLGLMREHGIWGPEISPLIVMQWHLGWWLLLPSVYHDLNFISSVDHLASREFLGYKSNGLCILVIWMLSGEFRLRVSIIELMIFFAQISFFIHVSYFS